MGNLMVCKNAGSCRTAIKTTSSDQRDSFSIPVKRSLRQLDIWQGCIELLEQDIQAGVSTHPGFSGRATRWRFSYNRPLV